MTITEQIEKINAMLSDTKNLIYSVYDGVDNELTQEESDTFHDEVLAFIKTELLPSAARTHTAMETKLEELEEEEDEEEDTGSTTNADLE